jgi:hypothetical protein
MAMRGARALVRFLAFSISARSTSLGGDRFASLLAKARSSTALRSSPASITLDHPFTPAAADNNALV